MKIIELLKRNKKEYQFYHITAKRVNECRAKFWEIYIKTHLLHISF